MIGHDLELALPLAPGTRGKAIKSGWQDWVADFPRDHPLPDSPFPLSSAPVSAKLEVGSPQVVIRSRTEVTGSHGVGSVCLRLPCLVGKVRNISFLVCEIYYHVNIGWGSAEEEVNFGLLTLVGQDTLTGLRGCLAIQYWSLSCRDCVFP